MLRVSGFGDAGGKIGADGLARNRGRLGAGACIRRFAVGPWVNLKVTITPGSAGALLGGADAKLLRPADRAEHARILAVFQLTLIRSATFPSLSDNELHA